MKRSSLAVIVATVVLSACGGGGGKRGVAQQSSAAAAPAYEESGHLRYASADTPKTSLTKARSDSQDANAVPAAGTLLNLLLAGVVVLSVKSRFNSKATKAA